VGAAPPYGTGCPASAQVLFKKMWQKMTLEPIMTYPLINGGSNFRTLTFKNMVSGGKYFQSRCQYFLRRRFVGCPPPCPGRFSARASRTFRHWTLACRS